MHIVKAPVDSVKILGKGINLIKIHCPDFIPAITPGQFCNIKVSESDFPLLRRPFSVCDVEGDYVFFMFDIHGEGTQMLSKKEKGDSVDILGPLGNGFDLSGDYETAVLIAGGIGAAPFPYLTKKLSEKKILTFIGGRSSNNIITYGMKNINVSTDDGSEGFHGNVVELFKNSFSKIDFKSTRVFACGPNVMLRALKVLCIENEIDCQVSTESAMACGFGICQGCPIESTKEDKYLLICKDGPVFNVKDVVL